jgi:serine/threonine protein kinase
VPDLGGLRDVYRDLQELDRRPEGIRYSATLSDGSPVLVIAVAESLAAEVRDPERFNAAMARAAALGHEAVAIPKQWGATAEGQLHCAYERLEQIPLIAGEQSPSDVAILGVQMARAVGAIHGAGLVHGAIDASTIMQTADRGSQLGRLGLFSALCAGGLGVQRAALGLSDPAYVSPEVQMGRAPDERSDVFSLGASLYDLLTGKPPYGGRTTSFVMASVLIDPEGDDRSSGAVAGPVVEALLRAIERAPDDRWPTADAFAQALTFGATSGEMPVAAAKQKSWISAIFRSWFPARRSRG